MKKILDVHNILLEIIKFRKFRKFREYVKSFIIGYASNNRCKLEIVWVYNIIRNRNFRSILYKFLDCWPIISIAIEI